MERIELMPIGYVVNSCNKSTHPDNIKQLESIIVVLPEYSDALFGIEKCEYLDIIFYFHKQDRVELVGMTINNEKRGVFASRSPLRPNGIGVTKVKVLRCMDNEIYVTGLDALNGSPVLDIKATI